MLFPAIHKTGAIAVRVMGGDAGNEMIRRCATTAGFTQPQIQLLGGHSLRAGFVTEAFHPGRMRTRSCGRPAQLPGDARGLRPGARHARATGPCPFEPSPETVAAATAALRFLPSHGWTNGMFGRRDR